MCVSLCIAGTERGDIFFLMGSAKVFQAGCSSCLPLRGDPVKLLSEVHVETKLHEGTAGQKVLVVKNFLGVV